MQKVMSSKGKVQASQVALGVPGSSDGEESARSAGDLHSIPGLRRSPGEWNSYAFQYSGLENYMDYWTRGHKESDTTEWLSLSGSTSGKDSTCQCRGCKRCSIDPCIGKIWRRVWQPPPVFLPGESHGQRGLAGYHPRGCKESNRTERQSKCKLSVPSPRKHTLLWIKSRIYTINIPV